MFAKPDIAKFLVPGKHGCTLGGNPICMAVARTIFDVIEREGFSATPPPTASTPSPAFATNARSRTKSHDVRGRGLMLGIELKSARKNWSNAAWNTASSST